MLFEIYLTEKLRAHLESTPTPPVFFAASFARMRQLPGYAPSSRADSLTIFHGREVRKVPHAAGGHGFMLHLSHESADAEGWTRDETADYNGWEHDSTRTWRDGARLESEGCTGFRARFGPSAFTLNHRFYFHVDAEGELWLSAEDGCEGRLVREK